MLKEVIERRRQWGETRDSDFDWLIKEVEKLQNYLEVYENTLRYMDNKYFKLEKQNNYYKEAIKYYSLSNDPLIACKALEESE